MNKVYDKGIELKTEEELGEAYYLNMSPKVKRYPYEIERITGVMCGCRGDGVFDLLPIDDPAVIEGGKRYMKCRNCGEYSHL